MPHTRGLIAQTVDKVLEKKQISIKRILCLILIQRVTNVFFISINYGNHDNDTIILLVLIVLMIKKNLGIF